MRNAFLILVGLLAAVGAFAQGEISFNNRQYTYVVAPVYGPETGDPSRVIQGNTASGYPPGTTEYHQEFALGGTTGRGAGANFICQLFAGPLGTPDDELQPLYPTTTFRTTATTETLFGFVQQPSSALRVPNVPVGESARIQMRVWEHRDGLFTTWANALAYVQSGGALMIGQSRSFDSLPLSSPLSVTTPLAGLESFNLIVPEPSVLALTVLAGAALFIRRRLRHRARHP